MAEEKEGKKPVIIIEEPTPKEEPPPPGPSFMALYTSLMMLLMTFFIVLFSMASTSTGKLHQATESIVDEFSEIGLTNTKQAMIFLFSYMKLKLSTPSTKPEENKTGKDKMKKTEKQEPVDLESPEKSSKVSSLILLGLHVQKERHGLLIKIPGKELFYPETATITHKGKSILYNIFSTVKDDYQSIVIRCYVNRPTESIDPNQPPPSSFYLSTTMASAISHYITKRIKIPIDKIDFFGNGEYRPLMLSPTTEEDIQRNNRVELLIKGLWLKKQSAVASIAGPTMT